MTATTVPATAPGRVVDTRMPLSQVVSDALAVAQRNLISLFRTPTALVFSTIQPVIFVRCFATCSAGPSPPFRACTSTS